LSVAERVPFADRNAVVRVAARLLEAANLRREAGRDREAGGVVGRTRDALAGRQMLEVAAERDGGFGQIALRGKRRDVGVDAKTHDETHPFGQGVGVSRSPSFPTETVHATPALPFSEGERVS
jgi:hypothetical protein